MSQPTAHEKTIRVMFLLLLMGLVLRGTAYSQSLADLARQQRAKKAAEQKAAPEYTNDAMYAVQPDDSGPAARYPSAAPAPPASAAKTHSDPNAEAQPELTGDSGTSTSALKSAATEVPGTSVPAGKPAPAIGNIPATKVAANTNGLAATIPAHFAPRLPGQGPALPLPFQILEAVIVILTCAAVWAVFTKAGEPGWASITPFYNMFVLLKIAAKPGWWMALLLIPLVNIAVWIKINIALARRFGKDVGFGIGLTFLPFIFYPVLAWTDASVNG